MNSVIASLPSNRRRPSQAAADRIQSIPFRLRSRFLCASAGLLFLIPAAHATLIGSNLLKNGTAVNPMSDSWKVITSGGDVGWTVQSGGDGTGGCFVTSHTLCNRYQIVELMPADSTVTAADLDAKPEITASEHICSSVTFANGGPDKCYLKVQLLGADKTTVLAEKAYGAVGAYKDTAAAFDFEGGTSRVSLVFTAGSYPIGARYLRFEDGGYDSGGWAGPYGASFDAAKVEFSQDTDGDGLPDFWELENGTQVNVADADADPDNDGLSNMKEFKAGTKANNPDTDGDGLKDGVENGTAAGPNYYASATATGTFPLIADSDHDGIPDGKEIPGKFVDINHPGTDPTKSDTDGDGVSDYREILSGTDPTDPSKFPTYTYTEAMKEDFDGHSLNSRYYLSKGGTGTYTPIVLSNGNAIHTKIAKLVNSTNPGNSNSLAFNQVVPSNALSVRLSFDYFMGDGADGIGIGFFKTSDFAATGAVNPGANTANSLQWETPSSGQGINGLVVGLSGYHNTVIVNSPKDPTKPIFSRDQLTLGGSIYNRVIITATANAPGTTAVSVDLILDVDGADPFPINICSAIVAEGFDISTDPYRIVFGARTGGSAMNAYVDNVVLSTTAIIAPETPLITASKIDSTTTPAKFVMTWTSRATSTYKVESSTTLTGTWTVVAASVASGGTTTSYNIPLPTGSPVKNFFRVTPN